MRHILTMALAFGLLMAISQEAGALPRCQRNTCPAGQVPVIAGPVGPRGPAGDDGVCPSRCAEGGEGTAYFVVIEDAVRCSHDLDFLNLATTIDPYGSGPTPIDPYGNGFLIFDPYGRGGGTPATLTCRMLGGRGELLANLNNLTMACRAGDQRIATLPPPYQPNNTVYYRKSNGDIVWATLQPGPIPGTWPSERFNVYVVVPCASTSSAIPD